MKKILITGEKSYIGTYFGKWMAQSSGAYSIEFISLRDDMWKEREFSKYDIIFHVAGLAHVDVGNISTERGQMYYKINRDLTIELAKKAKECGIKQFIYMSSIIVYGDDGSIFNKKLITKDTIPRPTSFYGHSKLQAEEGIKPLSDDRFKVVIVRPPMIYGKGSKGNYPLLSKIALNFPFFPNLLNQRSMIHIENLCEFIKFLIDNEDQGIFFPQNAEYVKTADMVAMIAKAHNKKIWISGLFNWAVKLAAYMPGKVGALTNKAFSSLIYEKSLSDYDNGNYIVLNFEDSIKKTEG